MPLPTLNIDAVFVYGTLKRGQCRETMWPETPSRVDDGWVTGDLYGRPDYPALMPGEFRVRGELWRFAPHQMSSVLATLDAIEGTTDNAAGDLYHRLNTDVFDLQGTHSAKAFTYRYNGDVDADGFTRLPIIDGFQCWPA